jgi:hypothetical protein
MTPCTSPAAPFYHVDLTILAIIEQTLGDVPCYVAQALTGGVVLAAATSLFIAGVIVAGSFGYFFRK